MPSLVYYVCTCVCLWPRTVQEGGEARGPQLSGSGREVVKHMTSTSCHFKLLYP